MSANQDMFDSTLRHSVQLRQLTAGEVAAVLRLLDQADRELRALLYSRLEPGDFTSQRYKELLKDVRELRQQVWRTVYAGQQMNMFELAQIEQDFAEKLVGTSLQLELTFATVNASVLRALVTEQPFSGGANAARTLEQWWRGLEQVDQARIRDAINMGMVQNETVDEMMGRVRMAMEMSNINAAAIVRTAVNHVSNAAREAFFEANSDIILALRWVSTLDGRTTAVCRARDGHYAPLATATTDEKVPGPRLEPPTARPPAHPNCRSVMVAVLSPEGVEEYMPPRAFVLDTRTRKQREVDFRAKAKADVGADSWKKLTDKQRNSLIKQRRIQWVREKIGQVPGDTTYDAWLRTQSHKFQDDVLGKGKAELFRSGLRLDQYVDRLGNELTLEQLRQLI